jgi:SAM-dependent methyltransferase
MRQLHRSGYDLADNLLAAFAGAGYWPEPGDKILDFGCGAGGLVYRLRDLGFDAHGFDIHDRVQYRDPADRRFFGFLEEENPDISDTRINPKTFRVPFDDSTFDVIVSTSVLEHVMDLRPMMRETARLLRPDGFGYHLYPNKGVFIEPHIYVPFGSRFQSKYYFYLWGLLGVRNEFQQGMSAKEVAKNNVFYTRTGLRYRTRKELFDTCAKYFGEVRFVDELYYPGVPKSTFWRNRLAALKDPHPLRALSRTLKMGSLLTAAPKRRPLPVKGLEPGAEMPAPAHKLGSPLP